MSEPRGVIYVMTSAIDGLVKIGKTSTDRFEARMQYLESNGYSNITGLQRLVAIEVDNYHKKEQLLHEVFSKHRIGRSEFFALDEYLIQRLLLALDGTQIYPKPLNPPAKLIHLKPSPQRTSKTSALAFTKRTSKRARPSASSKTQLSPPL